MQSDSGENVIFLAFSNPDLVEDDYSMLACKHCRNKTFTMSYDKHSGFPLMKCAACQQHMGRMGWASDDELSSLDSGDGNAK